MLGSVHDAEDALQDALLRARRALQGQGALRSWLYRIATNASLDVIERRRRHVEVDRFPNAELDAEAPDPEARYELREGVVLAFVAALRSRREYRFDTGTERQDAVGAGRRALAAARLLSSCSARTSTILCVSRAPLGESMQAYNHP